MKKRITETSRTTRHAYDIIQAKITTQDHSYKRLVSNARQYGLDYMHKLVSDNIRDFVKYVIWYYRTHSKRVNYKQEYIIYGYNLFIFTQRKEKLITILEIPAKFKDDAYKLKSRIKGKDKRKKKKDYYNEPLTK